MENGMVEELFENNRGSRSIESLKIIEDFFAKNLINYQLKDKYDIPNGYWQIQFSNNSGIEISIGSGRGLLEYSLKYENQKIDLTQYDANLVHLYLSSNKNINYLLNSIRRFLCSV